jgi:hypothetical protein
MPTLSVFCIGTGHTREEKFNLLAALHSLVAATGIPDGKRPVPPEDPAIGPHYKLIYDGPPNLPQLPEPQLIRVRETTAAVLAALQASRPPTASDPWIVNLAGHSRGAVACMMAAAVLTQKNLPAKVNMFLIDTVKRASTSDEVGLRILGNTQEFFQIVMEDEPTLVFKLANIQARLTNNDTQAPLIRHIRLPGTHGTATQCNPLTSKCDTVKDVSLSNTPLPRLWPLGGVAIRHALRKFQEWGSPLTEAGLRYIGQAKGQPFNEAVFRNILLSEYWRILDLHPFDNGHRHVNDVPSSKPGVVQDVRRVKGIRSEAELGKRAANPFRKSNIFVNQQHFDLFAAARNTLPGGAVLVNRLKLIASGNAGLDLTVDTSAVDDQAMKQALNTIFDLHPEEFATLSRSGLKFNAKPLREALVKQSQLVRFDRIKPDAAAAVA